MQYKKYSPAILGVIVALLLAISGTPITNAQSPLPRIESDDAAIVADGIWLPVADPNASGGAYLVSSGNSADVLTVSFSGATLDIIYTAAPDFGTIVIAVDNSILRTVDTRSPLAYGQRATIDYLGSGNHTARIYATGGEQIAVDAFVAQPALLSAPTADAEPSADDAFFPNPSPTADDQFGYAVDIQGITAIVGAPYHDADGTDAGIAYFYRRMGPTWYLETTLHNPTPAAGDLFGTSVTITQGYLVVGAVGDDVAGTDAGAVYLYNVSYTTYVVTLIQTILNPFPTGEDDFGIAVSLTHTTLGVGAPRADAGAVDAGRVYIYDYASPQWQHAATLENPNIATTADGFGTSLELGIRVALVGAPYEDTGATDSGAAYVFEAVSNVWGLTVTLQNPTPAPNDWFGYSAAEAQFYALVGTPGDDTNGTDAGIAYLFRQSPSQGTWSLFTTFVAPTPSAGDAFGSSVALDRSNAFVGAPLTDSGASDAGAVYRYRQITSGNPWVFQATVNNPTPAADDRFGTAVNFDNITFIVGTALDDDGASNAGSFELFDFSLPAVELRSHTGTISDLDEADPAATTTYSLEAYGPIFYGSTYVDITTNGQCTVEPAQLRFNISFVSTEDDFTTRKPVTVTVVDDANNEGPHTCIITHRVNDALSSFEWADVPDLIFEVDIADNDVDAPTNIAANPISGTQLQLSWSDTNPNGTGFRIERNTNGGGFVEIGAVGVVSIAIPIPQSPVAINMAIVCGPKARACYRPHPKATR